MSKIWLSSPHMGEKERAYVEEAFSSNWIAPLGPNVTAFEQQLAERLNVKGVLSLSSGSGALHLSMDLLNVEPNSVVICQSFTFAASAFPILYCGAKPVFVDSEADTWNMDPELLEEAIKDQKKKGRKISAIVVVHLYGMPAKMEQIMSIAGRYEIPVIEDAAEALGSLYHGKPCGSMGKIGILSFNGNKIITTSGGGALASNDEEIIRRARHISAQAKEPAPFYLHKEVGYNYRLSNVCAGIGRGQMEVLTDRVERRREIFDFYTNELSEIEGIDFCKESDNIYSNRWLTTILLSEKLGSGMNDRIRIALEEKEIETRPLWKPLHQQPVFQNCDHYNNGVSDRLFQNGLCLPSGSNLTEENLKKVVHGIKDVLSARK